MNFRNAPQGVTLPVYVPTGAQLSCKGWPQEAALRMLLNSIAVAEQPTELLASGGAGKVARDWESVHEIVAALKRLESDETLLVESGRSVGVRRTRRQAPRVLITGGKIPGHGVPVSLRGVYPEILRGACPERNTEILRFAQNDSERAQSDSKRSERAQGRLPPAAGAEGSAATAAASWTYLGPPGVLHTAYEVLAAANARWEGNLAGKLVVSGGMGGMGGALPLAAVLHGAAFLGIEAATETITRRIREGYCDYCVNDLDEAVRILKIAIRRKQPVSVGLAANCAEIVPELARRGVLPDVLTDQTCACDPLTGYIPAGLSPQAAAELRKKDPQDYLARASDSIARHVRGMLDLKKMGAVTFEFGNGIRAAAFELGGVKEAFSFPGFVEAFLEPLLRAGRVPLLWAALSGSLADGCKIDEALRELFTEDESLSQWLQVAGKYPRFREVPARQCWLSRDERTVFTERINRMVGARELSAPVIFAIRDAPPRALQDAEARKAGASSRQPLLDELANTFAGASWVALGGEAQCSPLYAWLADGTPKAGATFPAA